MPICSAVCTWYAKSIVLSVCGLPALQQSRNFFQYAHNIDIGIDQQLTMIHIALCGAVILCTLLHPGAIHVARGDYLYRLFPLGFKPVDRLEMRAAAPARRMNCRRVKPSLLLDIFLSAICLSPYFL